MHPLKRGWLLLRAEDRRLAEAAGGLVAAGVVTGAAFAVGVGVVLWLAGAFAAMALDGLVRALLEAVRPSSRHERRQARRVLRAVGHADHEGAP